MQDTHLLTVKKHLPKVNVKNTRVPAAQSGELNLVGIISTCLGFSLTYFDLFFLFYV